MYREVRAFGAALLFYGVFYGLFFLRSLLSGNYIAPSDSLDFGVAAYLSPPELWTEGMYSGYPVIADPQALTWYPVLHLLRSAGLDWNAFIIAPYIIASATCFLLVRRLSASNAAGIFSGFAYGFSGVMLGHIGHFNQIHAAAWVPLALYGLQLIREGLGRSGAAVGAAAIAMMWLAGHPQVPVYTVYLAGGLVAGGLLIDRPSKDVAVKRVAWSAVAMAVGFGIAAIVILPMIELGEFSRRSSSNWELYISKALPPWQLLGIALPFAFGGFWTEGGNIPVPYFGLGGPAENTGYVGLLPLALAIAAPFLLSRFRRDAWLWMALTLIAVLLCLGSVTPIGTLFFYAPGYASFRVPARHLFVVSLCVSVLSGLAFAEMTRRREGLGRMAVAVLATIAVVAVAFAALASWTPQVRTLVTGSEPYATWALEWPLLLAAMLAACAGLGALLVKGNRMAMVFSTLFIALHVVDLTMLHYRMPGYRLIYADIVRSEAIPHPRMVKLREELDRTGERVLATDGSKNQFLLPNLTRPWRIPSASGTGSLGIERYLDALGMGGPGDVYPEVLLPPQQGIDLFSIRYALVRQDSKLADDLVQQAGRWTPLENLHYYENDPDTFYTLFRNERVRPRAWCVSRVVRADGREPLAAIRTGHLLNGAAFDPGEVAIAGADVLRDWPHTGEHVTPGEVVASDLRQRRYLVNASSPCVLVISEVYYPWWRASVDDSPAEAARVNHTMIGVSVPAGSHVVRLWLQPTSVWIGGAVAGVSLLVWIAIAIPVSIRRPRVKAPDVATARLLIVVGLTTLLLGCSRGPLRVSAIQLGRALGADNSVAVHTTVFKPNETIYVSVLTEDTGSGTIVARWSLAGQTVSEETKHVSYSGAAATEFHFQSADGFPPGQYKVEILVDGQQVGGRDFRVDEW